MRCQYKTDEGLWGKVSFPSSVMPSGYGVGSFCCHPGMWWERQLRKKLIENLRQVEPDQDSPALRTPSHHKSIVLL